MTDIGANQTPDVPRNGLRRTDGELILLWTLPATLIIWIAGFFVFPGFNPPMSPTMTAEQVAAFYRDPAHLPEIRYSMIVFNWFGVCLVPTLALIVLQIRRMAHRTPIFSYAMLGCVAGGPTLFLIANVCWLLAAFLLSGTFDDDDGVVGVDDDLVMGTAPLVVVSGAVVGVVTGCSSG